MSVRVDFVRVGRSGGAATLFRIWENGARILASGPELADAILVLRKPLDIAERKIVRAEKPLEWIAHLPAAYGHDALAAAAPEKDDKTLLDVLLTERTLLAFGGLQEFFYFEAGQVRDAARAPVSLARYRRAIQSEGWEVLVPLKDVLEASSPHLVPPTLDELTRDFFTELEGFRREYANWAGLYRRGEVWDKVLFGTPDELRPKHLTEVDRGLLGRVGAQYYPRIERGPFRMEQVWRMPEKPGGETTTIEAAIERVILPKEVEQGFLDFLRFGAPLKIFLTPVAAENAAKLSETLKAAWQRTAGPTSTGRLLILLAPPLDTPHGAWHVLKVEPAAASSWLFSAFA